MNLAYIFRVVLLRRKIPQQNARKITSAAENILCDVSNEYTNPNPYPKRPSQ